MKRLRIGIVAALIAGELGGFYYLQTYAIRVERAVIRDPALASALGRARVAQISDLHVGRYGLSERLLERAVKRLDPDVLLITGDFVSSDAGISPCAALMHRLSAGRTVIASLGNNDHYRRKMPVDTDRLVRELNAAGVAVLQNRSAALRVAPGNAPVYIVGFDDNYLWLDDRFSAMENLPRGAPRILLAHSPHIVEKIDLAGINLVISGHTHGGQISLPIVGPLYTNAGCRSSRRFAAGLYEHENTPVYVNRGIGSALIPLRLFAQPEITLFEFKS